MSSRESGQERAARRAPTISYLYVIAAEGFSEADRVKIGRSVKPASRRSQLQTGHGEKLRVVGSYRVRYADAPRLEASVKAALAPLKIKGEVFGAPEGLACAVVEHIAIGREIDEFIRVAVQRVIADREWLRLDTHSDARGRWASPEIQAARDAARIVSDRLFEELVALDVDRLKRFDPIAVMILDLERQAPKKIRAAQIAGGPHAP